MRQPLVLLQRVTHYYVFVDITIHVLQNNSIFIMTLKMFASELLENLEEIFSLYL